MMLNAPAAKASSEVEPGGISLAHYAAIRAALAEGFAEAEVLKAEGVEKRAYQKADLFWKQTLVKDNDALDSFIKMLADAEDALGRSVQPLSENALAWVSFLHVIERTSDPGGLLTQAGLGLNDLSRLSRRWKKRVETNETLGKDLGALRKDANAKTLPNIVAGPKVLKKSRFAREEASKNQWLDGHHAMLRKLVEQQAENPLPPAPTVPFAPPIANLSPTELQATALALDIPRGPVLPFVRGAAELPPIEEKPARTHESLSGTGLSLDIPTGPALPFGEISLHNFLPPAPAGLGMTTPVLDLPKGDALPFVKSAEAEQLAKTVLTFQLPKELQKPKTPPIAKQPAPELALYTYAALCAQLAQGKTNTDEIFKSFGLADPEARNAVDITWKKKLQSNPALYAEWLRLFQYYSSR